MRKRMTSLLLTLVMLLSLVPAMGVTANAADGFKEVKTYEELKAAVDKGEAKVKLVANIDTTNDNGGAGVTNQTALKFFGNDNILDLNGYTLKLVSNTGTTFINVNKDLTIQDSGTSGRIDFVYGPSVMHRTTAIYVSHASNEDIAHLTVKSGTLSSTKGGITLIESIGNLTINGGKFYAPYEVGTGGTYAIHTIHQYNDNAKTIITGGEIDGVVFIQRTDSAATGTPNYGDIPVQIKGGTFKQHMQLRWTEKGEPSGYPTEFSPAVEIAGGIFEKRINPMENGVWGRDLSTKLTGGTFKDYTSLGLGKGDSTGTDYKYYLKSLGNSIIMRGNEIRTSCDWSEADWFKVNVGSIYGSISLDGSESNPVTVIPNAWGMKSVTLDGEPIDYAKDWNGAAVEIDNSKDHTLTFEWYPLAQELKDAGYTYRANFDCYTVGSNTPTSVPISATAIEYSHTILAGAAPSVYPFDLQLNLDKNGSSVGIIGNQHIVKLVVSEAPPAPPAPVAHSITIINGFGTATPKKAIAGESITVKANDRTADNMMFTQWYTETPGVTFANATQRETTFVMPDSDVKVNPGYHGVSFTNQPVPQISLEKGYGGKTSFAFSWDISKWELVDTATNQTVSSDNTPVKAGKLTDVTIPANTDLGHKTYRIVVTTANGEQFKSNDFIVTWFEKMPAPLVEFSIPSDTKFIGEMTVNVGYPDELNDGTLSPYVMYYTTNGVDPKDADPSDVEDCHGSTDVTLNNTTTIKARTILKGEGGNEDTWGELCEATYTMIDKLDAPTVTPESCSYSGSLPIIVTIQDVYNAEIDFSVKQHDGYLSGGDEPGPMLETGLPDTFCGTTTFRAKAIVYKDGGGAWESDEVTYTYTREYWANISNATISGKVNKAIADTDVTITLDGEKFKDVAVGDDASGWFNLPEGLTAKVKEQTSYSRELVITISGTPTATSAATITVTIPKDKLLANGTVDLTVLSNPKAVYNIGTDAAHTHDYTGQPYLYLDPGNHYQECTAGDGYNILAHEFTPWTDNSDGTHSRHCTVCKMTNGSTYTETAEHTWVWVVDQEAALNQPGKQHEECTGCHAERNKNTEIPALQDYAVTVTGGTAAAAAGTPITRAMEGVEVTVTAQAPAGKHFVKWVVKAGGVTLANETSATTTFIMPATDVEIEANFEKNASTGTGTGAATYPITVKSAKNGDVTASHKTASKGTTVTLTVDPDKGYVLDTLTVLDGKDKELKLTEKNGKYTFTMPDSKVTVAATFKASAPTGKNPFIDVPAGSYYEDAVIWAVDKGITTGMSAAAFDPNGSCTRAQIVTFLWRAAGSPEPKTMKGFDDVASNAYYAKAVAWAVENGITTGTSASKFSPNDPCTRTQAVTFLFRYATANGMEAVTMQELLSGYADAASVPSYAVSAMNWALAAGILQGDGVKLMPNATCTRAQIVTFLYRSVK